MTTTLEIADAEASFLDLMTKVEQGESVILTQSGIPVAQLVPYSAELGADCLGG